MKVKNKNLVKVKCPREPYRVFTDKRTGKLLGIQHIESGKFVDTGDEEAMKVYKLAMDKFFMEFFLYEEYRLERDGLV